MSNSETMAHPDEAHEDGSQGADAAAAARPFEAVPDAEKADALISAVHAVPDVKKADVAAAAINAVPDANKADVAAAAMSAVPDANKADVAAAAVNAVPDANKADAISTAIRSAPTDVSQQVLDQLLPDQKVTNEIWLWVVITFAVVLGATTIALIGAIFVGFWRKIDTALVQILLTVVTTIAGILAGFISGRASTTRGGR